MDLHNPIRTGIEIFGPVFSPNSIIEEEELQDVPEEEPQKISSAQPLLRLLKEDVAGANPPSNVISGFVKRVWPSNGVDKPVIIKEWKLEEELLKHDVSRIPLWVKLYGLDIKFWGVNCLKKICGHVGQYIKCDDATKNRDFMGYARIMVEVQIGQQFPTEISFIDENGKQHGVRVVYDWLPTTCTACKGMGYTSEVCRKGGAVGTRKEWRPKPTRKPVQTAPAQPIQPKKVQLPRQQAKQRAQPPVQKQPIVIEQPRVVPITPVVQRSDIPPISSREPELDSMPRRFLTRMMRSSTGERRMFTPRGMSFMESLTLSLQKTKAELVERVLYEKGECSTLPSDNGLSSGGDRIWLIWDPTRFVVTVLDVNAQSLHAEVFDNIRQKKFWYTMVYGFNHMSERGSLWQSLRSYHSTVRGPWMVGGDFNSIMAVDERIGGAPVTRAEMRDMSLAIQECELHDMKGYGSFLTWNNKHEFEGKVYSRIDRVFINDEWLLEFPESNAHFLPEGLFDHCPCLVSFEELKTKKRMPFKYFNMWSQAYEFKDLIHKDWAQYVQGTVMFRVVTKLKQLKRSLRQLNSDQFSDIENLAKVTELSLEHLQEQLRVDPLNEGLCIAMKACAKEVEFLNTAKLAYLRQKSKVNWMKEGDENSNFFHSSIKRRRAKNRVYQVKDMRGVMCSTEENIKCAFKEFYISLLGTSKPVSPVKALKHLGLMAIAASSLKTVERLWGQKSLRLFRELSKVLPDVISSAQGAFIKGRDIVGNTLIYQDLIRLYKRKSCSPRMLMKLDLQKAYDSIEWSFVEEMLKAMRFPEKMVTIIMQCVTTPSYSIALNGEVFGFFKGKRGLRQGDPLSPLLFTICLDYLSRILDVTQKHTLFRFHPLCQRIGISHLCFADDLILFCKGERASIELMLKAYQLFSKASGLIMNASKSNFYCNGMDEGLVQELEVTTGMKKGQVPFKYLGVSVSPTRLSVLDCDCLVDKVTDRIRAMGSKHLSYAGRAILIKSIFSTLHNYWSRIFILPKTVLRKIEAICREFLWHGKETRDSPSLVAWEKICRPKKQGGLGFTNLILWNVAALTKYVWWIENKEDHLWVKWVYAVYIKDQRWFDYEPTLNSSWSWRKICQTKNLMKPFFTSSIFSLNVNYTVRMGYSWLLPAAGNVTWYPWSQNNWMIPKHRFIGWLMVQQRLLTQDRLIRMHILQSNICFLCGVAPEDHPHLFFLCKYSQKCCDLVSTWCRFSIPLQDSVDWWVTARFRSLCQKKILGIILVALIYQLWMCRNCSRVELSLSRPEMVLHLVQKDVTLSLVMLRNCKDGEFSDFKETDYKLLQCHTDEELEECSDKDNNEMISCKGSPRVVRNRIKQQYCLIPSSTSADICVRKNYATKCNPNYFQMGVKDLTSRRIEDVKDLGFGGLLMIK
ncbi:uncharacterized protein LOC141590507 [Silene latifolia]|uniref:uncharacterized protein LOC141590507 n=1 Tax=Silene latifolia TaxID=37657 RepID=UPI003D785735